MNLARVVGRLWTIRKLPELEGLKILFHLPMNLKGGRGMCPPRKRHFILTGSTLPLTQPSRATWSGSIYEVAGSNP